MLLEFSRHIGSNIEVNLPFSLHINKVELIFVTKEHKDVIEVVVVHTNDEPIFMLSIILGKYKFITTLNGVTIIFELIDQLICGQKGDVFCFFTEATMSDVGETFKDDGVEGVEVVVLVISNLTNIIIADHYESSQLGIIETAENLAINCDFFPVMLIFTIGKIIILIQFVYIVAMVKDEERALGSYEETVMFLKVGGFHAVVLPDLSTHQVETDELVVHRYVHFVFFFIEVIVR